jgi:hypothetical protein
VSVYVLIGSTSALTLNVAGASGLFTAPAHTLSVLCAGSLHLAHCLQNGNEDEIDRAMVQVC